MVAELRDEVLDWIEDFKEQDMEVFNFEGEKPDCKNCDDHCGVCANKLYNAERIYRNGNCYFFAQELHKAFKGSEILFIGNFGHAVVSIGDYLFDINGLLLNGIAGASDDVSERGLYYIRETEEGNELDHMIAEGWSYATDENGPTGELVPSAMDKIFGYSKKRLQELFTNGFRQNNYMKYLLDFCLSPEQEKMAEKLGIYNLLGIDEDEDYDYEEDEDEYYEEDYDESYESEWSYTPIF